MSIERARELVDLGVSELSELLPKAVLDKVGELPEEYFDLSDEEIVKRLRDSKAYFTKSLRELRARFWAEYEDAISGGRRMRMSRVYGGVVSKTQWYRLTEVPVALAYVVRPYLRYEDALKMLLETRARDKFAEVLDLDIVGDDGRVQVDVARLQVGLLKQIEERLKGLAVQRSEKKEYSVSIKADGMSIDEVEARIRELESSNKSIDYKEEE